jgi:hypothetical protein
MYTHASYRCDIFLAPPSRELFREAGGVREFGARFRLKGKEAARVDVIIIIVITHCTQEE